MLTIAPAPTVRPPSRIAKRCPISIAIGVMGLDFISTLSAGSDDHLGALGEPDRAVTSVVRSRTGPVAVVERGLPAALLLGQT